MHVMMSVHEFEQFTQSPHRVEENSVVAGCQAIVVDLKNCGSPLPRPGPLATTIIGLGSSTSAQSACDLITNNENKLQDLLVQISAQPVAAFMLTQVLRHNENVSIADGLLVESTAYSNLQHSAGFQQWLQGNANQHTHKDSTEPLLLQRDDDTLILTLNRPEVHNAYDADLKDSLCAALQVALADQTIKQVHLAGAGASFCAGGDLSEFGQTQEPAGAHVSRTTRSAAAILSQLSCATSATLQGACIGAGIELPAFTQHITAHPDSYFQLPELSMGLIPGAGGTVSIPRRIGRHRTAHLAMSNEKMTAQVALDIGLVDRLTS